MAKMDDTTFRVKLEGINDTVIFNTMPNFTETVTAKYEETTLTHSIGTIHSYVNSPGRNFGLNDIKLVSRNSAEARRNLQNLLILKSWTKSYFGVMDEQTENWLGAPPEVVYFSAYASSTSRGNFYRIPVVITSVSTQYTNDIDYIPVSSAGDELDGSPFPTLTSLTIEMVEQHSASELEKFKLSDYKLGKLTGF